MTATPYWLTGISPMPVKDLAMRVDDLFTTYGFIKDYLYAPPNQDVPAGYCVAGAVNQVLTGTWTYPRQYDLSPADTAYTHGPMQDFAVEFGMVAQDAFPALWREILSQVMVQPRDGSAPVAVLNMIAFNNHPDVTLADMRRVLMLMR